jgi:hypothetical protein
MGGKPEGDECNMEAPALLSDGADNIASDLLTTLAQ